MMWAVVYGGENQPEMFWPNWKFLLHHKQKHKQKK